MRTSLLPRCRPLAAAGLLVAGLAGCSRDPVGTSSGRVLLHTPDVYMPNARRAADRWGIGESPTTHLSAPVVMTIGGGADSSCGPAAAVHLTGELTVAIRILEVDGERRAHVASSARGTAVGDDGARYLWEYAMSVPPGDIVVPGPWTGMAPTTAALVDDFRLHGVDGAPDVAVRLRYGLAVDEVGLTVLRDPPVVEPACGAG